MSICKQAVRPWLLGFFESTEEELSKEIERSVFNHDAYADRSLIRGHLKKGYEALKDAEEVISYWLSDIC